MHLSRFIREQDTATVDEYRQRVRHLAAIYVGILIAALAAIVVIVVRGRFFVTLAQRSNVETLTLALVLVLFAYLVIVSAPGAWGALVILWYNVPGWLGADRLAIERRKQAALARRRPTDADPAYLNCAVRLRGDPDARITIPLTDDAGSLGTVVIAGTKLALAGTPRAKANSVFAFVANRIERCVRATQPETDVAIVQWSAIDDDAALQYASLAQFAHNLERQLGAGSLWPSVELSASDVDALRADAATLCPALRDEAHLPDVEYEAEHRLPIIPEPLAFISLSRHEQRADPVASMGCAFLVTAGILALVLLFLWMPPWVPSK